MCARPHSLPRCFGPEANGKTNSLATAAAMLPFPTPGSQSTSVTSPLRHKLLSPRKELFRRARSTSEYEQPVSFLQRDPAFQREILLISTSNEVYETRGNLCDPGGFQRMLPPFGESSSCHPSEKDMSQPRDRPTTFVAKASGGKGRPEETCSAHPTEFFLAGGDRKYCWGHFSHKYPDCIFESVSIAFCSIRWKRRLPCS